MRASSATSTNPRVRGRNSSGRPALSMTPLAPGCPSCLRRRSATGTQRRFRSNVPLDGEGENQFAMGDAVVDVGMRIGRGVMATRPLRGGLDIVLQVLHRDRARRVRGCWRARDRAGDGQRRRRAQRACGRRLRPADSRRQAGRLMAARRGALNVSGWPVACGGPPSSEWKRRSDVNRIVSPRSRRG